MVDVLFFETISKNLTQVHFASRFPKWLCFTCFLKKSFKELRLKRDEESNHEQGERDLVRNLTVPCWICAQRREGRVDPAPVCLTGSAAGQTLISCPTLSRILYIHLPNNPFKKVLFWQEIMKQPQSPRRLPAEVKTKAIQLWSQACSFTAVPCF